MRTLVTGGTGLVGRGLVHSLGNCVVTSRNPEAAREKFSCGVDQFLRWNAGQEPLELRAAGPIDAVVNLVGENVAEGRWTAAKKQRIRDSRVMSTRHLVDAIERLETRPKVLVSASAVGIYGDGGEEEIDEFTPLGSGFLADVCRAWEAEAMRAESLGVRVCIVRIGIVLSSRGGALAKLVPIFRWGMGGVLGSGLQFMPWIHVDDLNALIINLLETDSARGVFNGTSPNPVRNREFTQVLAKVLRRPAPWWVPGPLLKLALGGFAEALLQSQRVVPRRMADFGFIHQYPQLEPALRELLDR